MRRNSKRKMNILVRLLNVPIEVLDRKCTTELFDQRDAFHFNIICIPYLDSNITSEIFY